MNTLQIKNRWTGSVIFEYESENNTIKKTLLKAIEAGSDLRGSDLRGSDLRGSDLRGSDLSDSNLRGSDLHGSDLRGSDLSGSDLRGSDLSGSDLSGSDLSRSDLSGSDLSRSDLSGSNLSGSDLSGSDLSRSDLSRSNLSRSNLRGSDLRGSDLRGSDLTPIKNDLFIVLLHAIPEIKFLKQNIIKGKIDGSTYEGECSCLSGTLHTGATVNNGENEKKIKTLIMQCRDSTRPIERFFLGIKIGDTPKTNQFSKLALEWIEEFEMLIALH